jgi:transcription antitermination factor NusG
MSDWLVGDRVQVLAGPFSGFKGTVARTDPGGVIVRIRIFDRDTPVALEADQLAPDDEGSS